MKDLSTLEYHPISDNLVKVLTQKTQSTNELFFHVLVAYYLTKITSMMRATIDTHDRGKIPINLYAINLASSGQGKGHSTNIIEEQVINLFRDRFLEETFPLVSERNLAKLAVKRATKKAEDPDEELERVKKEFIMLGQLAFSFDSGTPAAVKQMRHKLLMSSAGSMNMEIDEIGSNLLGNVDVLNTYLELYDVGKIKQKLTKNTLENVRSEEIEGRTPTNMMLFGTPSKLLNGGKTEDEFLTFLDTGYARRCFFGHNKYSTKINTLTPNEVYDMLTDTTANTYLTTLAAKLGNLADMVNFNKSIQINKAVSLLLIEYKLLCEKTAFNLPAHEEIRKAEISHRYFKVLKLAGTYAFIDNSHEITEEHLYNAIKLAEESGKALVGILAREGPYIKLAKYIASVGREVTHVDLVEKLPSYKGSEAARREQLTLAIAWGYKNNIIIKKTFTDGIEFLKGESLQETNIDRMVISYSTQLAENYKNEEVPFDMLHKLMLLPNYHWVAHHMLDGYRKDSNAIPGFNLAVIDVDEGVDLKTAQLLLKDYKYLMYSTKRSTDAKNRFRIVFPMNYTLHMGTTEYKEFMANIYEWLPFSCDMGTDGRERKWMTHTGKHYYNDGALLDVLLFIPKTSKNEERKKVINDQQSLSNMERWFVNNTGIGNRSNMLIKYALMLVDSGMDFSTVQNQLFALNAKLPDKMEEAEIASTILITVSKAIYKRDA